MTPGGGYVILHTAFIGDLILTLPVTQALRRSFPGHRITVVAIPAAAAVLRDHPSIDAVIVYDKRGADRGIGGFWQLVRRLRQAGAGTAIVPHRSLRSALAVFLARIPRRIGFDRSAGRLLFTDVVRYDAAAHEVDRNLALLGPCGITDAAVRIPVLPASEADRAVVDRWLQERGCRPGETLVGIAPGSVWFTKRWPARHFAHLVAALSRDGIRTVLAGGEEDRDLCQGIAEAAAPGLTVLNAAGAFTLRQSGELFRRCSVIVTNDSAPLHLAGAVGTVTFAIFGATVPSFGFGPLGPHDRVFETHGLACRPCAIHGGKRCPIGTFVCMEELAPGPLLDAIRTTLAHQAKGRSHGTDTQR